MLGGQRGPGALHKLVDAGALRIEERWDVDGDGGRLTNDYYLLEHRNEDPGRTDAAPPGPHGCGSPRPHRCGSPLAARTRLPPPQGAAPPAAGRGP